MKLAASVADMAMNRNTRSPLYELRLSATGAIDSQAIEDCVGIWAPMAACVAGLTASMARPGKTPAIRHSADRSPSRRVRTGRPPERLSPRSVRGRPRKVMPNALAEAGSGERGRQRQHRPDRGRQYLQDPGRHHRGQQDGLESQPFGNEAVKRRQRRNGDAADQEHESGAGHVVDEAAKVVHVAFSRSPTARRRRRRTAGS